MARLIAAITAVEPNSGISATPTPSDEPTSKTTVPKCSGLGCGSTPERMMPSSDPPPKADMMIPNAAAPSRSRIFASTGIPTVTGPITRKLVATSLGYAGNTHHDQREQRRDKRQCVKAKGDSDAAHIWHTVGSTMSQQRDQGTSQHRTEEQTELSCALHKGVTRLELIF